MALDEQQERIRTELQLDGVIYVYKSGERQPPPATGFDLTDATVALACSSPDISLAVQAKREIGKLWEDISREPYTRLFNPSVSGVHVWRMVQILRMIEEALKWWCGKLEGRDVHFAVHGNRFVAHLVYRNLASKDRLSPDSDLNAGLAEGKIRPVSCF